MDSNRNQCFCVTVILSFVLIKSLTEKFTNPEDDLSETAKELREKLRSMNINDLQKNYTRKRKSIQEWVVKYTDNDFMMIGRWYMWRVLSSLMNNKNQLSSLFCLTSDDGYGTQETLYDSLIRATCPYQFINKYSIIEYPWRMVSYLI